MYGSLDCPAQYQPHYYVWSFRLRKKKTLHYLGILDESKVKLEESSFNYNQLV